MELTVEILEKIEDKLWKNLEELNKDEKKWIEHGNASHYSMCHFNDSYRYISCINMLQGLREVVNDDKYFIKFYGLAEFETEEDDLLELSTTGKFKIVNDGSILANTDLGTMVIPPAVFEEMVKEAIIKGNLTISSSINQTLRGSWMNELEIEMKPKTEEEEG